VGKITSGSPNILDLLDSGAVKLVINTPSGRGGHLDEAKIRQRTITLNIPCITTIPAARAAVNGIRALKAKPFRVRALQDYFPR
jgi:carbamoyl-phosphate synthase large subunit